MDSYDLFRKLGAGAKFDVRRFVEDAERFKVVKHANHDGNTSASIANLDFFGVDKKQVTGHGLKTTTRTGSCNEPNHAELGVEQSKGTLNNLTRKRKGEMLKPLKKQKSVKMLKVAVLDSLAENDSILWMSSLEAKLKETGERKPTAEKLERLRQEKISNFRNKRKIYIQGTDIPEPIATFQQLHKEYKIHDRIIKNVQEAGFQMPTPIQMQAMPIMLHADIIFKKIYDSGEMNYYA